jgi:hypothetical protein
MKVELDDTIILTMILLQKPSDFLGKLFILLGCIVCMRYPRDIVSG